MSEFQGIEKCSCPRKSCGYFAPLYGEYGSSFTENELKEIVEEITTALNSPKLIKPYER